MAWGAPFLEGKGGLHGRKNEKERPARGGQESNQETKLCKQGVKGETLPSQRGGRSSVGLVAEITQRRVLGNVNSMLYTKLLKLSRVGT